MRKKILKFMRKGNGEAMGFTVAAPVVILVIYVLILLVQLTLLRQRMEYAAYSACRAAAVSSTKEEAMELAQKITALELNPFSKIIQTDSVKAEIKVLKNQVKPAMPVDHPGDGDAGGDLRDASQTRKNRRSGWIKGSFIQCTVKLKMKQGFLFRGKEKKFVITMALEKEDY